MHFGELLMHFGELLMHFGELLSRGGGRGRLEAAGGARGGWRRFWGGLYRLFCRTGNPGNPPEVVAAGASQTLPSTRAGGQDDVS